MRTARRPSIRHSFISRESNSEYVKHVNCTAKFTTLRHTKLAMDILLLVTMQLSAEERGYEMRLNWKIIASVQETQNETFTTPEDWTSHQPAPTTRASQHAPQPTQISLVAASRINWRVSSSSRLAKECQEFAANNNNIWSPRTIFAYFRVVPVQCSQHRIS